MTEIIGLSVGILGAIAACIAAVPVVASWLPIDLSDNEKAILRLAVKYDDYPGIIQYYIEPVVDRTGPCVNSPYKNDYLDVTFEILELRDKGLLAIMDGTHQSRGNAVWYQLTGKGFKTAKSLASTSP